MCFLLGGAKVQLIGSNWQMMLHTSGKEPIGGGPKTPHLMLELQG